MHIDMKNLLFFISVWIQVSQKQYKLQMWLLSNNNGKSYVVCQTELFICLFIYLLIYLLTYYKIVH